MVALSPAVWIGVAALGGLGALLRFAIDGGIGSRIRSAFPWGTFCVNVSGSFALGVLTGAAVSGTMLVLAGTAVVGAYTTFSTWMFESHRLAEAGAGRACLANIVGSLAAGLAAVTLGHVVGTWL